MQISKNKTDTRLLTALPARLADRGGPLGNSTIQTNFCIPPRKKEMSYILTLKLLLKTISADWKHFQMVI